jgi:DNA-binding NarL/FixJ family response regulator
MTSKAGAAGAQSRSARKRSRILLVDDHPIVRHGLVQLVSQEPDLIVCGDATRSQDVLKAISDLKPDVVVMDISLDAANGIELTKMIHGLHPELPVLMHSMHDETLYAERALKAGAMGYIMKQEAPDTLLKAIRKVLGGERYLSEKMTSEMLTAFATGERKRDARPGVELLSDRELEVFELVGRGRTTKEIAAKLHLSVKTVETHYARIKEKLALKNATELTHRAIHWVYWRGTGKG